MRPTRPKRRRPIRRYPRLVATVIGVAAVSVGVSPLTALPAIAAPGPVTQPGQASADSNVIDIVAQTGGAPFTVNFGEASSAYNQSETQAKSATLDLGGLGYILANLPVCGQPALPQKDQPQPLTFDSASDPGGTKSSPGNVAGLGTESVSASNAPESATATTKPVAVSLGQLVQVAAVSTSRVQYLAQGEQKAAGSVSENLSLVGGLVQIDGLTWTASTTSGSSNTSSARFSLGRVTIGVPGASYELPSADSAASAVSAINKVVGVFGVSLVLPTQTENPSAGEVAIGPLDIHFAGSASDRLVVDPLANLVAAVEAAIKGVSSNGSDCSQVTNLIGSLGGVGDTVFNLVLGIADGGGSLDVGLGGASASTQPAPAYADPFAGGGGPFASGSTSGSQAQATSGSQPQATMPDSSVLPGATDQTPAAATPPSPTTAGSSSVAAGSPAGSGEAGGSGGAGASSAVLVRCVTASPAGGPGCWKGLGTLAGAATVVAAGGVMAADVAYSRRRFRRHRRRRAGSD